MQINYIKKDSVFIYYSVVFHIFILILGSLSFYFNFEYNGLETTSIQVNKSNRIKLHSIRNTRMKIADNAKIIKKQNEEKKKIELQKQQTEKKIQNNHAPEAMQPQSKTQRNNKLEMAKIKNNSTISYTSKETKTISKKNDNSYNSYKPFQQIENIEDYSSQNECKSVSDVQALQFHNDLIEFVAAHWIIPNCLLDKKLNINVKVWFTKTGEIIKYEIQSHPKSKTHEILEDSIIKFFHTIKNKRLPVNGRKLKSYQVILKFNPKG